MTLYLELGGRAAIRRALEATLSGGHPEQVEAREEFAEFLVFLFGGAPVYEGPALHQTVAPFCCGHQAYDRLVDALTEVLTASPQAAGLERDVRRALEQVRCHVVRSPHPVSLSAAAVASAQPRYA
ncbi:hypothetical protein GWI72_03765 [Microvirga tunisiensis]|uniref:Uncharacterized protein n=2 Tax=Pannonibacter tanglangensis TaxID=2750084 RepID=A0ABW9ZFW8_9HYPH|nr:MULTISPECIES: hypothetical protein [unclassified Pannonibacter]NBN63732.1 hypothetical protein [Pannonibacter sp. XCT-34]NBN77379.1 hypothetical protein [Pannonibacter sp. XCT-53]